MNLRALSGIERAFYFLSTQRLSFLCAFAPLRFCVKSTRTHHFPFLVFLFTALFLAGCSPREPRADLVIVNGAEPESLDPAIITGQADSRVVLSMFEGLTRFDPKTGSGIAGL